MEETPIRSEPAEVIGRFLKNESRQLLSAHFKFIFSKYLTLLLYLIFF